MNDAASAVAELPLSEDQVVAWLWQNADVLSRHPDLLETLEFTHASGGAVSLIERQVALLRGKNQRLHERITGLKDFAATTNVAHC